MRFSLPPRASACGTLFSRLTATSCGINRRCQTERQFRAPAGVRNDPTLVSASLRRFVARIRRQRLRTCFVSRPLRAGSRGSETLLRALLFRGARNEARHRFTLDERGSVITRLA